MSEMEFRDELRYLSANSELFEIRDEEGGSRTLAGHFARFNEWTTINSTFEGRFMERLAPTSLSKTIAENRSNMRVLFQHGKDPQIGEKVLGPISELRAESKGAYYEVDLLDTSYNRDLMPGLEAGLYGASFRFQVMQENFDRNAEPSEYNPDGLPERTITEAKVLEFGPVTFPAYEGTTAGLRSATDWWLEKSAAGVLETLADKRAAALEEPIIPVTVEITQPSRRTREEYLTTRKEARKSWELP